MLYGPKFFSAILWTLLLLTPILALSQAPKLKFKHITDESGLSNSTIEHIFQDSRGFMWFGTRDGLNRYDGYQMVVFRYDPKDSNTISDNYITQLFEDRNKTLWVGTINGLNRFDPSKNWFTRYKHNLSNPRTISNNYVTCIFEDKKNRLWISTLGGGINLFDPLNYSFSSFRHDPQTSSSLNSENVFYLYEDKKNNFWVGTDSGIQLFTPDSRHFTSVKLPEGPNSGKVHSIRIIKEDMAGNLLLGTSDNGIIFLNPLLNTFRLFYHKSTDRTSISSNLVRSILVTRQGNIWTGTINGGLDLFDPVSEKFYNYQNQPEDPQSLSQRTVSALFEDNQGNIWIGTHRGGINLYTPKTEKFKLYRQELQSNSLSYNDVKAFCEDGNGGIWIGTDGGGLNLFDRTKNSFSHYKYNPFDPNSIGSNEVLSITEDSDGKLWVGTWGGGLCLYNSKKNNFTRFLSDPANKHSISSNYIQKIFEDSKKNLWVATYFGGLNIFDRNNYRFNRIISDSSNNTLLQGNNIVSINEDKEGNLWVGTDDGGLNCITHSKGDILHYFDDDDKKPDLRVIFVDSKGRVWVGQAGLYLFDPKQKKFSVYTDKAGLSEEFIKGIAEDEEGNFWISTSNGITQFNPTNYSFRKYNTADGLQGLEYEANAFLKTRNGQVFFGGVNGFNSFYPKDIVANSFIPPVSITDFQLHNKKVSIGEKDSPLEKDIAVTNEIILNYKQSTFSFSFAALNFTASENNQYAYKLEGWNNDWIFGEHERKASFTNVNPGEYTFRVKASNNDGVWNETGPSIKSDYHSSFLGNLVVQDHHADSIIVWHGVDIPVQKKT